MLAGILAACLAVGFAEIIGEPQIEHAIAFETELHAVAGEAPEPAIVSRVVQRSIGLLTACVMYGAAYGGLFSLMFAFAYGRIGGIGSRTLAALLAGAGFLTVVLVPDLKYPANPPSIGEASTIGLRTAAYFEMIVVSIAALTLAVLTARRVADRLGTWNAFLLGAAVFIILVTLVQFTLPDFNEIPDHFPADLLWRFRVAALAMQALLWGVLGIAFGGAAERLLEPDRRGIHRDSRCPRRRSDDERT